MQKIGKMIKLYVIVPAGGSGMRFGKKKQFAEIKGKPLILHTVEKMIAAFKKMEIFTSAYEDAGSCECADTCKNAGSCGDAGSYVHSVELKKIIVAVPREDFGLTHDILGSFSPLVVIVPGGETRAESVKSAYRFLHSYCTGETEESEKVGCAGITEDGADFEDDKIVGDSEQTAGFSCGDEFGKYCDFGCVAVHDACRPLVSSRLWNALLKALVCGAHFALPYTTITDTVKRRSDLSNLVREDYITVQTPQVMTAAVADRIYRTEVGERFGDVSVTDDATLAEKCGIPIILVEGERMNIKVTAPEDIFIVAKFL